MHTKDEVLEKYKIFKTKVDLQYETSIKCLRNLFMILLGTFAHYKLTRAKNITYC